MSNDLHINKHNARKEDKEINSRELFVNDFNRVSDLSRLQAMMQKYSNLDPDKLTVNKANALNNELKKAKSFK